MMTRWGSWFLFGACAAGIVFAAGLWAWLACHSPAWAALLNGAPSCAEFWLNRYQGLIGALATLFAGFLAYRAVLSEAQRAERQAREAKKAVLQDRMLKLSRDLDNLTLAASYVGKYVERFAITEPSDKMQIFNAFRLAHSASHDFTNMTATAAPGGYGERIQTLMTAIQQLGKPIEEGMRNMGSNPQAASNSYGDHIIERITGLKSVRDQIRADVPHYERQLVELREELAALQENR